MRNDERLFRIGNNTAKLLIRQLIKAKVSGLFDHEQALLFFFLKSFKTHGAAVALWRKGYSEDAYTLARTIYELRLQALYLGRDPKPRGTLFMRHRYQAGWGTFQILKRKGKAKWQESLEAAAKEVRDATIAAGFSDVLNDPQAAEKAVKRTWWGKTIRDLATSVGAEEEYEWVYSQLSDHAHSGSRTLHAFVEHVSESNIQMHYRPQRSDDLVLPWSITNWLCDIVMIVNEAYDLGIADTVSSALASANRLLAKNEN
jgi:hypothetical protein